MGPGPRWSFNARGAIEGDANCLADRSRIEPTAPASPKQYVVGIAERRAGFGKHSEIGRSAIGWPIHGISDGAGPGDLRTVEDQTARYTNRAYCHRHVSRRWRVLVHFSTARNRRTREPALCWRSRRYLPLVPRDHHLGSDGFYYYSSQSNSVGRGAHTWQEGSLMAETRRTVRIL